MRNVYLVILLSICSAAGLAQDDKSVRKIDSLKKDLKILKDADRLPILKELFESFRDSDYTKAIVFANEYFEISKKMGDSVRMIEGGRMKAYSLLDFGKNEEVIEILTYVLDIAERNQNRYPVVKMYIKFILNNLGIAYLYLGNYDKALECQFRSLLIREEEGDKYQISIACNNIGLIFYNLEDYGSAVEYYQRAIKEKASGEYELGKLYTNLSLCLIETGEYEDAIYYATLAFKICRHHCIDDREVEAFQSIGNAYRRMKEYDSARKYLQGSLETARKTANIRYQAECLSDLGILESEIGRKTIAFTHLNDALKILRNTDFNKPRISIYQRLSNLYYENSDYKNYALFAKRYIQLRDSIYNSKMIKNLAAIRTHFAGRDYIKRIKEREQLLQLKDEVIERQKSQVVFISISGVLFLILALVLYKSYRNKQLANHKLEARVKDRTSELREVNSQLQEQSKLVEMSLKHLVHEGRSITSQIKGLCNLAAHDLKDETARHYFEKVEGGTSQLSSLFSNVIHGGRI